MAIQLGININSHPQVTQGRPADPSALHGMTWVRMVFFLHDAVDQHNVQVNLFNNDWTKAFAYYDTLVNAYRQAGINTLFILNQQTFAGNAPWFPGSDGNWSRFTNDFTAACAQIAAHFKGRGVAYEIWNEGDSTSPASVFVDPTHFGAILHAAYQSIKAQDASATVVLGGLASGTSNSISYVNQVRAALGGSLPADAIGIHPYGQFLDTKPNIPTAWFGHLDQDTLAIYGSQLHGVPTWITELGVSEPGKITAQNYPDIASYLQGVYSLIEQKYSASNPVLIWFAWSDVLREAGIVDANAAPKQPIYDTFLRLAQPNPNTGATLVTQPTSNSAPQPPMPSPAPTPPDATNPLVNLALAITAAFEGNYDSYQNIDNGIVSYGRFQQTLASGNLANLVNVYLSQSQTAAAQGLRAYQARLAAIDPTLRGDTTLRTLLQQAAQEKVMQAAQDQYGYTLWDNVQSLTLQPRGIQTPLGQAMLYDTANQHGLHHPYVVQAEDALHVPERSVIGQNGATEAQLILEVAQLRQSALAKIAAEQNLPGVLVRANFWLGLIQNGDWNLSGGTSGIINANGRHLTGLSKATFPAVTSSSGSSSQGIDALGARSTPPPTPVVTPAPTPVTPMPVIPTPVPTPVTPPSSLQLDVPWVSQLDGDAASIGNDCGHASVLMLLQYYNHVGPSITVKTLYGQTAFRNANGMTNADQLVGLANAFGLAGLTKFATGGVLKQAYGELQKNRPVIVLVNYASLGFPLHLNSVNQGLHWLIVSGYDTNGFIVNDPLWMGVQRNGQGGKSLSITEAQLTKAHVDGGAGNFYIVY